MIFLSRKTKKKKNKKKNAEQNKTLRNKRNLWEIVNEIMREIKRRGCTRKINTTDIFLSVIHTYV